MRLLSNRAGAALAMLCTLAVASPATSGGAAMDAPPGALILFGANWCAPCRAELAMMPALANIHAPAPLILAWTDGWPASLRGALPRNVSVTPPVQAARLLDRSGGVSAGLPFAVLLDGEGRVCAVRRGKMDESRLARLRAECGASQAASVSGS